MDFPSLRRVGMDALGPATRALMVGGAVLTVGTAVVAALEAPPISISDASIVYLVPVVIAGALFGTWAAIGTAVGAFALYDFLFIEPLRTLAIEDPREWLELLLFLFIAVAIGRLTARESERAREAARRAQESQALFAISRMLATTPSLEGAAPAVVERLARDATMDRIWIALETPTKPRILADTHADRPPPGATTVWTLARTRGELPAQWVRVHVGQIRGGRSVVTASALFRVKMEADGEVLGYLWALRARHTGMPAREHTRLLALAADQLALAVRREQLAGAATEAEVARRSEALKTALLDSVSHDFRTPLGSIRATAGSLADPAIGWTTDETRRAGLTIEAQVDRLSRFVTNLLDASRIESGALRAELELFPVPELVEPVVTRLRPTANGRSLRVELDADLPPVRVDPVLFDHVLTNLLENALRHTPDAAPIRIGARSPDPACVDVVVEDGGPGVSPSTFPRLFDKFSAPARRDEGGRRGLGLGLSVVRGLVEAMGGEARAVRSDLGGLAVHISLVAGAEPPADADDS